MSDNPLKVLTRVKDLPANDFSFAKTFQYEKEAIAAGILLFSNYTHAALVFLPAIFGILIYLNSDWILTQEFDSIAQIQELQYQTMVSMLEIFKITSLLLVGYFGILKFKRHKHSGDYGYWLAMGMGRKTFYNYTVLGFSINGILSAIILVFHILLLEKFYFPVGDFLALFLLLFSSLFLMVSLLFFISEAVDNAEIGLFSVGLLYIISLFLTNVDNPLNLFFNAELHFRSENRYILFAIQLVSGILVHYLGWRIHRDIDVQLGG